MTVDVPYFKKNLEIIQRDLSMYSGDELARSLARLAKVADEHVLTESEFQKPQAIKLVLSDTQFQLLTLYRVNNYKVGNTAIDLNITSQAVSTKMKRLDAMLPDDFFMMIDKPYKMKWKSVIGYNPKYEL